MPLSGIWIKYSVMFDVEKVRRDFPILGVRVYDKPLVYLDSGATAQKPECVIETVDRLHRESNANIHRGGSFSFGGGYRDVRGCPGSYRRVHRCGSPGGGRFHGRSYCVAQYGGVCMVRTFSPGGRQYRGQRDGAPFQYRSLAACRRAQGVPKSACCLSTRRGA